METKGFAPEVVETVLAEETNDVASSDAINIDQKETGIARLEDKVQLPVIPATLNINGIELNIPALKEQVEVAKKMVIDGLGDKKGYDDAKATLKAMANLRTSSEKWRKQVMAPVLKFGKDLKKPIDEAAELCESAETYLKDIIKPIEDAVLIAQQQAEEAKDLLAVERAAELVKLGGVFDGQGTYNFPYDPDLFVLQESLRELAPEAYIVKLDEIQASYDIEQKRLQAIEDAKVQETTGLKTKLEDLNAERTESREEILQLKGFTFDSNGFYTKGDIVISAEQLLYYDKDQWKELLNPTVTQITPDEAAPGPIYHSGSGSVQGFAPESTSTHVEQAPSVGDSIVSDFAGFAAATPVEEQPVVEAEKVMTRTLVFSEAKPFVEFAVGTYTMAVFPNEYASMITFTEDQVAVQGQFNDQLQFKLIENAGA